MSDPLSVLASVASVVTAGSKVSHMLYTTINRLGSVPHTVVSLSRELEALCKALGYLETIFRDHNLSAYPQFPADLLLEILNSIMMDFRSFGEILAVHGKQHGEGLLRKVWKQSRFVLRDEEIAELRTSISGYKLTMDMTMTAINLSIAGRSSAKTEQSLALLAGLRDEITACKHLINHGSMIAGCSKDRWYGGSPGDAISGTSQPSPRTSWSSYIPAIAGKGDPDVPNYSARPASVITEHSSQSIGTLGALKRRSTDETSRSDSGSIRSYRAASIMDLYCDGLAAMSEEKFNQIEGTEDSETIRTLTLGRPDTPVSRHDRDPLEVAPEEIGPYSDRHEASAGLLRRALSNLMGQKRSPPTPMFFSHPFAYAYFGIATILDAYESESLDPLMADVQIIYLVTGPRLDQWATWIKYPLNAKST